MAQGLAAAASLALAVKLKKIFEDNDKYLAFPIGLGFSNQYFEFMKEPAKTSLTPQEQLNLKADFARQMNMIPEDKPLFAPDGSRFLWDEVRNVLTSSIFPESALSPDEENRLAEAIDFLTDDEIGADGIKVPVSSPPVRKYYEYKTLYEEAERNYLDEQISVQFAVGEEGDRLRQIWEAYREKQLREARHKAQQDWLSSGFKLQVEEYQSLRNALEVRKYLNIYRENYLAEIRISEISDLNGRGIGFLNTFFSPLDVFEPQLPWATITLTKQEILGLIGEASEILKSSFGAVGQDDVPIEAITLEYNKIVVIRPWLKEEFFGSRYWKLPDERVVCDGHLPRAGLLPAFVTSMVVARNIRITRKKDMPQGQVVIPIISKIPVQELKLSQLQQVHVSPPIRPQVNAPPVSAVSRPAVVNAEIAKPMARTSFVRADVAALNVGALRGASTAREAALLRATTAEPGVAARTSYAKLKSAGTTIKAPAAREIVLQRRLKDDFRLQPQAGEVVTETINLDGVSVLALVCKRLPKCPDPDASLQW